MLKAESVGLVEAFALNGVGPKIPFIQFADDSLFLLKAEEEGVRNLRCILLIMEAATGLKVNWEKSSLSPVGEVSNMERLSEVLGL